MSETEDIVNAWAIVNQILAQDRGLAILARVGIGPGVSWFVRAESVVQEGYWFPSLQCERPSLLAAMQCLKAMCDCQKGMPTWGAKGVKP